MLEVRASQEVRGTPRLLGARVTPLHVVDICWGMQQLTEDMLLIRLPWEGVRPVLTIKRATAFEDVRVDMHT